MSRNRRRVHFRSGSGLCPQLELPPVLGVRAQDDYGQALQPRALERRAIGKAMFKVEAGIITTSQRIQIRKVQQKAGINVKQGVELSHVATFLQTLQDLAARAGGEAPKPTSPDTALLNEIRLTAGNEQLFLLYNHRDQLIAAVDDWTRHAQQIEQRWPAWLMLKRLLYHAASLQDEDGAQTLAIMHTQVHAIEQGRQLLEEPDLVAMNSSAWMLPTPTAMA